MSSQPPQLQEHDAPVSSEEQLQRLIETISRSQQGFRDLIDHLDQAVFTITLEGQIRVANARFAEIVGASFQDLIGHNISEFLLNLAPQEAARALPAFLKAGSWSGRLPFHLKKSAELRYFDCFFQAVAECGQVIAISGWARDVTAQRQSELRSSELFESVHEGVLFSLPSGKLLDANPAMVRMLGYSSKEELLARNFADCYANRAERADLIADLQSTGFMRDRDITLLRKNGSPIRCLSTALVVRDASGATLHIQSTIRDITEQREMAHELHKEREFGRRLIACFPDVIALLDAEGHFTYLSESVRSVLGHPPSFFLGRRLGTNSTPEDRARLEEMLDSLLSGRTVRGQVEVHADHADGSRRSFRISAAPLLDEDGKITGIVTSGRDVTESNMVERRLADREKFTAMGQMLAGAAHELNNPLTAILGVSDLLCGHPSDELVKRQSNLILKQARRAADIVQNLLAFSRPRNTGLIPLRIEDVVNQVLLAQKASFDRKGIAIKFDAAPNLPPIDGDRKLLSQVFSNIVVNAEQAISAVKQNGTLSVSLASSGDDRICLTFENDGPPIAPENVGKLFDPFFTTKRPGGGSGLGLTICLAIVKDHGGTIEVDTPASGGATFRIYLPAAGSSSAPKPAPQPAQTSAMAKPSRTVDALRNRTALIVDDEESILEILQEGLTARGMKVTAVARGQEGLAHLEKNPCDVIICDFNMPGMKGAEFFERVLARFGAAAPRFIFITGELVESAALSALHERGAMMLQKPFSLPALTELLQRVFPSLSSS